MSQQPSPILRYFELRRRAIEIVDSVSQTRCRHCAEPCCERRLCMKAFETFQPLLHLEPKAEAIRRAAAPTPYHTPFVDSAGCLYSILRPTVCLAYFCSRSLEGLLRSQQLCVLAMGRAFPDAEVTDRAEQQFLAHAVEVCEAVVQGGERLPERDKRQLLARIPGVSERLRMYVVS